MTARHGIRVGLAAAAVCTAIGLVGYRFGRAHADGAPTMQPLYYGGVLDDGGRPVEGTRNITVRLWDAVMGGTAVCTTVSPATAVSGGRFRVALEASCASAVQANPDLWAEVIVDSTTFARQKLGAVPYALEAGRAAGASGPLAVRLNTIETAAQPRQVVVYEGAGTATFRQCTDETIPISGTTFTITPSVTGRYMLRASCEIRGIGQVQFAALSTPAPTGLGSVTSSNTFNFIEVSGGRGIVTSDSFDFVALPRLNRGTPYTIQISASGRAGRVPSSPEQCVATTVTCRNISASQLE